MGEVRDDVVSVLRERLRHVYWVGGSGAGKSTIVRRLAARHGLRLYATDDVMANHARRRQPVPVRRRHDRARSWPAGGMRAVSSMAAAQECSALVTAAVSAGRAGGAVDLSVSRVTGR
jgi:predicted kinase